MNIELIICDGSLEPSRPKLKAAALSPRLTPRWLKHKIRQVLTMVPARTGTWQIHLVRDAAMTQMHRRTMGVNTTTDVLTFDLRDHRTDHTNLDLETLICVDEARRQAHQRRHPVTHEVLLYAIHSLLHVQGYDDRTPRQSRRIHRREDQILLALGIGPVYDCPVGRPST